MSGYVDLHAHHLSAVDDGAPDLGVAVDLVNTVIRLGFVRLYATPHQRSGMFMPSRGAIDSARAELNETLHRAGTPPVSLGFENFWDEVLAERIATDSIPSYDDGPAFLFEVATGLMPAELERTLFDLRLKGKVPVMAHPERYSTIQNHPERAETLGRTAALVIDLAALDGAHGRPQMRAARQLVLDGLVHAAATDIHRPDDGPAIAAGMAWLRKKKGPQALDVLLSENPRRILSGELPETLR
jgi:protein-tyrosine phosphatase